MASGPFLTTLCTSNFLSSPPDLRTMVPKSVGCPPPSGKSIVSCGLSSLTQRSHVDELKFYLKVYEKFVVGFFDFHNFRHKLLEETISLTLEHHFLSQLGFVDLKYPAVFVSEFKFPSSSKSSFHKM